MKKLKPHRVDWVQIKRFLQSAERKLASAHKILLFDEEAFLQQAYEAMLKAVEAPGRSETILPAAVVSPVRWAKWASRAAQHLRMVLQIL